MPRHASDTNGQRPAQFQADSCAASQCPESGFMHILYTDTPAPYAEPQLPDGLANRGAGGGKHVDSLAIFGRYRDCRIRGDLDIQRPGRPEGAMRQRMVGYRRPTQTPLRPDSEYRRNSERLRRA